MAMSLNEGNIIRETVGMLGKQFPQRSASEPILHHPGEDQSVDSLGNPRDYTMYLPMFYWEDHTCCECGGGELLKESGRRVLVRVSIPEIDELISRAYYYATLVKEDRIENREVHLSAKRTLGAIGRWFKKNPQVDLHHRSKYYLTSDLRDWKPIF